MKNRLLLLCTAFILALSPALRAESAMAPKSDEPDTELETQMKKINKAFKALSKKEQIGDPTKNAASLELVATIKSGAEASLNLKPKITAQKPAEAQAKFVEGYQAEMKKMLELVGKLETALKADKNDEATKLIADMNAEQKAAHTDYRAKPKPKN